jgi:holo-[acyl-carrier protein] synthase
MIIGLGIDAVDVERVDRMFADKGDRMLARLFTPRELAFLSTKMAPAQHMAVRLAAKEAAYKALAGNALARGIGWREVEVISRADGAPELQLHGRAAERFVELGAVKAHVSLTHSAATAVAVVVIEGPPDR